MREVSFMKVKMIEWPMIVNNLKENIRKCILIILILSLIGLALGGAKYISQGNAFDEDNADTVYTPVNDENVYVLTRDEYEKFSQDVVYEMYQRKEYYTNSILMHVNPYEINAQQLCFNIKMKDMDNDAVAVQSLVDYYDALISSQECYEYICEKADLNIKKQYLDELITYNSNKQTQITGTVVETQITGTVVETQIIGESGEQAEKIADALVAFLQENEDNVMQDEYPHELNVIMNESTVISMSSLSTTQRSARMDCAYYYASGGSESVQNTFRLLTDFDTQTAATVSVRDSLVKLMAEYGCIGFIMGIIVVILYILAECFRDDRIYDYGTYCTDKGINGIWLTDYYKNRKRKSELNLPLFLFDLKAVLSGAVNGQLLIACPFDWDIPSEWSEAVKSMGISYKVVDEFMDNEQKLEKIYDAQNIMFICKYEQTTYKEMNYMVSRLNKDKITSCSMVVI
jgi:hypothetical protein